MVEDVIYHLYCWFLHTILLGVKAFQPHSTTLKSITAMVKSFHYLSQQAKQLRYAYTIIFSTAKGKDKF